MIVPETYHVPFCATHAQTFFASEQPGVANTSRMRTTISPGQLAAMDSFFRVKHLYSKDKKNPIYNIIRKNKVLEKCLSGENQTFANKKGESACEPADPQSLIV